MDKLNELKALADLAQQLEDNGHYVEANTVHNKFIRIAQQQRLYTVKGDFEDLSDVAANTGFSIQQILGFNPGIKKVLKQGQTVKLPPAPKKENPKVHTVSQGETLTFIANKRGIPLQMLLKINPGINPDKLYQGQQINLP
jgi:hypothetical protein